MKSAISLINCAVIGNPIAHSLSPIIHQAFATQVHIALNYYPIEGCLTNFEQQVIDFFNQGGIGLNVTLPFKTRAFVMADIVTSRCQQARAANTLWMDNGQLYADNTDGVGLIRDISRYQDLKGKSILIFGAGGAARGIIPPLLTYSKIVLTNRSLDKLQVLLDDFPCLTIKAMDELDRPFDIIINATSSTKFNLPQVIFSAKTFCYDLNYNREKNTPFVEYAKRNGCEAMDGIGMLIEQAAESFMIWHGIKPLEKKIF